MAKKSKKPQKQRLFEETLVPAQPGSGELFDVSFGDDDTKSVECFGMTFPNDAARRVHFTEKLREKLKDRAFRKSEGFPIGDDEDILALSDPPYYTACPNPFLAEFNQTNSTLFDASTDEYLREPFAADVSEGKSDPIYNAHGYHTKVPHKAIMRYILHYTAPGQVVLDGFAGTGMTGVAAQLCGDRASVESLGYKVEDDGSIVDEAGNRISKLGSRFAVLGDLSPAATFISANYNTPVDAPAFRRQSEQIIADVEANCGWMYLTLNQPTSEQLSRGIDLLKTHKTDLRAADRSLPWGRIIYTIWSEVFRCVHCSGEVVFWDAAVDKNAGTVRGEFPCPHCSARLTKRNMEKAFFQSHDSALHQTVRRAKLVPVLLTYMSDKKRLEKTPDDFDRALLKAIDVERFSSWIPTDLLMGKGTHWGDTWRSGYHADITNVHHFYTHRNLEALSRLWASSTAPHHRWLVTGISARASKQHQIAISRVGGPKAGEGGATAGHRRGTLYIPSNQVEFNPVDLFQERLSIATKAFVALRVKKENALVFTGSASQNGLPDNSIDYIFTDPPFGENIMYSELNSIWEGWLKVRTNNIAEAIMNRSQGKNIAAYTRLMLTCFRECYRVLKPNRWITVEFHNSSNAVWTAIQEALQHAGFVVSDVRTLDKKIKTHTQRTAAGSVNKDLAITAYKPSEAIESQFLLEAGTEEGAWHFTQNHLRHVPVFVAKNGRAEVIAERQSYLLFDRMVAFHVQRGYTVPMSAVEFYAGLRQRFAERDSMYFLADQAVDYDSQRRSIKELQQLQLFVTDEKSAIMWVRQLLSERTMRYQDLQPLYMREAQRVWEKYEQPLELRTILEQNFVEGDGQTWHIPDPKREGDLEQIRNRALMKEFQQYMDTKGKLKVVRTEALRAGFKEAWQKKNYTTIVQMVRRIPVAIVQEDPALLMYFDNASLMLGE